MKNLEIFSGRIHRHRACEVLFDDKNNVQELDDITKQPREDERTTVVTETRRIIDAGRTSIH